MKVYQFYAYDLKQYLFTLLVPVFYKIKPIKISQSFTIRHNCLYFIKKVAQEFYRDSTRPLYAVWSIYYCTRNIILFEQI